MCAVLSSYCLAAGPGGELELSLPALVKQLAESSPRGSGGPGVWTWVSLLPNPWSFHSPGSGKDDSAVFFVQRHLVSQTCGPFL